ncbi:E3 ubiquitin-protein ligase sspH2 [Variovorax sp. PBS-H4]|uniref:leucine-rich repeat-containing protein kinase family protein n=1 Tax=Variovorax sp. PBS-H4 TaxID=434008 RepID=UPI00131630D7|nr:leucine-rich repeat-containing protein kinase family protein [Variovorax sp. PBS-H4]VTU40643.1 E3 ubiquitin-protein ligase sspH2 [Variovorax sp. PBS-H4]
MTAGRPPEGGRTAAESEATPTTPLERLRSGQLAGARRLALRCGLTEFPREIFALADTLEELDLSGNALSALPEDLGRLHRLRVLFCSDNRFTELPTALGRCGSLDMIGFKANRIRTVPPEALPPALRWLILTDNEIDALPRTIGRCTRLQKLMLAGNRLESLPAELAGCRALELLRISANRLEALPDWLPALPRLAWLAFAGNPFADRAETAAAEAAAIPAVDWRCLSPRDKLGEGASGVIHSADWTQADGSIRPVAVKLFKGEVTSDGWPHSEMAACIAAGAHPNLIAVEGRILAPPEGATGLVLALVDPRFRNLAGPPSLESCTRDVYADDASWPVTAARRLARGIASAVAQLHAHGIVHGDVYAHNILWDGEGNGLLGDFGAASFLPPDNTGQSLALQRIEARAFGLLLGELRSRCRAQDDADRAVLERWAELERRCTQPEAAARPRLAEIASALTAV